MKILLFDMDGTLCESGEKINIDIANLLNKMNDIEIGIVGGGTYEKIIFQLNNLIKPKYIFSECGSVYHLLESNEYVLINKNNIRLEKEYHNINKLIKLSLLFLSNVDYIVSGNFIDLRNGLVYISLIGMQATKEEREYFIKLDKINNYRINLLNILKNKAIELGIENEMDINLGGSVGIGIYPKKWNKTQILNYLDGNNNILHYFGDKYLPDGNDYNLLINEMIIPHRVDFVMDTYNILLNLM